MGRKANFAYRIVFSDIMLNILLIPHKFIAITEIMRCIHIGLLCLQESVTDRPTMAMIVLMLNSYFVTFPVPSQPAFFMHSNIESDHNLVVTGSEHSRGSYVQHSANEASITELYIVASAL